MNKILTTILLTILFFGCKAQEPDFHGYTQEYMDSVIISYEQRIENLSSILESPIYLTSSDTCKLVSEGVIYSEINKKGDNVWYTLIDGSKRINADYIDGEIRIMIMDSLLTIGSAFIP